MNIFACDTDPIKAASCLPDKLIVKMPLETAQILCTVLSQKGFDNLPYKPTHKNHPVMKWCHLSEGNIQWLIEHGRALCKEYTYRYGKTHKCQSVIEQAAKLCEVGLPRTNFVQCMPDKYKSEDPVQAYRSYMIIEKSYYAKWKNGNKPDWWDS